MSFSYSCNYFLVVVVNHVMVLLAKHNAANRVNYIRVFWYSDDWQDIRV